LGLPVSSELSTEIRTVDPSGAMRSTTMSVPLPLRSGSLSPLTKRDDPAPATTE
jgi:hypothetical protein